MGLRIFPIVGESLNFGGRRMATIARVAWLPIVLLLVANMAAVFIYLSVITGRSITFTDVASFTEAQQALGRLFARGLMQNPLAMGAIFIANFSLQMILVSSFMAPLIRLAGLGEAPRPGLVRMPFGADQLRYLLATIFSFLFVAVFILAPIFVGSFFSLVYIVEALTQTYAVFPDPNSLHSIEITTYGQQLAKSSAAWTFNIATPLALVAPFAFILWALAFAHFHPRNRPNAPSKGAPIVRGLVILLVVGTLCFGAIGIVRAQIISVISLVAQMGGGESADFAGATANTILVFGVVAYLLATYVNLRLYPYPGVAVCRKSMGLGQTLKLTRGWDLIRLQLILVLLSLFLLIVQVAVINALMLGFVIPSTVRTLYQAVLVTTQLVNSGEGAAWVQPLFIWTWNIVKILINIFWLFFSYGAVAGLYGRLYRESEKNDGHHV